MPAYYNENDPKAAQWLRNLIAAGRIAPGDVDDRSIEDVRPSDLLGYEQCHFFAGIGVWSYALRRAGWADDRPVWTGSCPCQPFSAAGKRGGTADERHLWPAWEWLQRRAKPRGVPVFGEQVASKDGLAWLDAVQADLEGQGYTVRALDLCAAGVGAPHIRQRLFFVAESGDERHEGERLHLLAGESRPAGAEIGWGSEAGFVADTAHVREHRSRSVGAGRRSESSDGSVVGDADDAGPQGRGVSGAAAGRLGDGERAPRAAGVVGGGLANDGRLGRERGPDAGGPAGKDAAERSEGLPDAQRRGHARSFWSDADWLPCIDGKARPVEPGTFPLAHGAPARVVRLRAYGNAIVAPLAEEFIRAYLAESALRDLL